jgi:hypothetical protein
MKTTIARHRPRALLAMTLAITTGAAVAAMEPVNATPAAAQPATGTMVPLNLPTTPGVAKPKQVQPVASDNCTSLKPTRTGTSKRVVCLTTTPNTAQAAASTQAAAGSVTPNAVVGANCTLVKSSWEIDRTTACIQSWGITAEIREEPGGPIIATEHFSINQNIILNTNSPGFVENDTIKRDTLPQAKYSPTGRINASIFARCDAPCQANNPVVNVLLPSALSTGNSKDFSFSYFGNPTPGSSNSFNTHYSLSLQFLDDALVSDTLSWSSPESIRCDDMLRPRSPGCVFAFWGPLLTLPVSVYGAAAVNVAVGQTKLIQPFGTSVAVPLTRGSPAITDPNRNAICDGTFFPSLLLVQNDSCDEFPFASTQQSAAQRGFTGLSCLEIMPLQKSNGEWTIWLMNGDTGKLNVHPCVRGHVNNDQNVAVGRAVQTMYTNYRMITGDPYGVEVDN